MKSIAILGSTGSIGTQALSVIAEMSDLKVTSLACGRNISLLEEQARKFMPHMIAVEREEDAKILRDHLKELPIEVLSGDEGLIAVASDSEADMVLSAVVGMMGIRPTMAAINAVLRSFRWIPSILPFSSV